MQYKEKKFHVENISTEKLAKKFNTPLYCYSYLKLKIYIFIIFISIDFSVNFVILWAK